MFNPRLKRQYIVGLSLILPLLISYLWGFHLSSVLCLFVVEYIPLMWLCKDLLEEEEMNLGSSFLFFQLLSIVLIGLALYLILQYSYKEGVYYIGWLLGRKAKSHPIFSFETATIVLMIYGIVTGGVYGKKMLGLIRQYPDYWFPPMWSLIIAIGLGSYIREDFNHTIKMVSFLICTGALMLVSIYKHGDRKNREVTYVINSRAYCKIFLLLTLFLVSMGVSLPRVQALPGSQFVKEIISRIGGGRNLIGTIPLENKLTRDVPKSDEILFEVEASEPLYLRQIAYSHYENNTWSIPGGDERFYSYISFKPVYLEAEYAQLDILLEEIEWLKEKNPSLFNGYQSLLMHDKTVVSKKKFYIPQNPRNVINFFTVNGMNRIDSHTTHLVYYYYGLENIYFHSEKLVEPSSYSVSYYDRKPKYGTREYIFLKQMNADKWLELYSMIEGLKNKYEYDILPTPKVLRTYTPLRQYRKAKENFMQIPEDLEESLRTLTLGVVSGDTSDWDRAEAIEEYLKYSGEYVYNLEASPTREGKDSVEHFLFEQKEGICQDFASSMVLMCRSIGLPARYVVGYLVNEQEEETGTYIVRANDAHAFVEVYLAGYGWMQFDPTPSVESENKKMAFYQMSKEDGFKILLALMGCGTLGTLYFWKGRSLREWIWRQYFKRLPHSKKMEALLSHLIRQLEYVDLARGETETLNQYAQRLYNQGIDIRVLINGYERYYYGGHVLSKEELESVFENYKGLSLDKVDKVDKSVDKLVGKLK